ncbi:MAG TPA: hypothetical protein DCY25_07520 [Bacteroidales bacterium]|nr:hypothetical protein [Bacteroidales bacterium]
MSLRKFSANMKILYLMLFFMCLASGASAPTKGYALRRMMIVDATRMWDKKYRASEFERFIDDLGKRESGNNWLSVNCIGCFGEWQFKESTVQYLGFKQVTLKKFKKNPEIFPPALQRSALESLIKVNMALLKDYERYIGLTINGVTVTRSGMIAAAHLGGAKSVRLFLTSGGRLDKKDTLGTAISNYMKKFSFYDI